MHRRYTLAAVGVALLGSTASTAQAANSVDPAAAANNANAYVSGHRPTFEALHQQHGRRLELPTYPFQRRRFWPKSSAITVDGPAMSGLLGSGKDLASDGMASAGY